MRRERRPPDDPLEWLNRARSNLEIARAGAGVPGVYLEDLCFDAQQAAEKAVKAVLLAAGIRFPFVHDLTNLLALAETHGQEVPEHVKEAGRLTRFAIATRYPGVAEPVTRTEYDAAVALAAEVVRWAEQRIGRQG